jgi:hypothetical protein
MIVSPGGVSGGEAYDDTALDARIDALELLAPGIWELDATGSDAGTGLTSFNIADLDGTSKYRIEVEMLISGTSSGLIDFEPDGTSGGDSRGVKHSAAPAFMSDTTFAYCAWALQSGGAKCKLTLELDLTNKTGTSIYQQLDATAPLAGTSFFQWATANITSFDLARTSTITFDSPSWTVYKRVY